MHFLVNTNQPACIPIGFKIVSHICFQLFVLVIKNSIPVTRGKIGKLLSPQLYHVQSHKKCEFLVVNIIHYINIAYKSVTLNQLRQLSCIMHMRIKMSVLKSTNAYVSREQKYFLLLNDVEDKQTS